MPEKIPNKYKVFVSLVFTLILFAWGNQAFTDEHDQHRKMLQQTTQQKPSVNTESYQIPNVELINSLGEPVRLPALFDENNDIALNFIFTTCTTICPVMTSTMIQFQKLVSTSDTPMPLIVSISIDPSYDQASILKTYAETYGASWTFLTGTSDDIYTVLKAFRAYRGNKVNHFPLTLLHSAGEPTWTRIDGLTSAKSLKSLWSDT